MILAIDAGNTRIKWGLFDHGVWLQQGTLAKADILHLSDAWKGGAAPTRVIASNVAGDIVRSEIAVLLSRWRLAPEWIVAKAHQCGVISRYQNPAQLGCDRWAALIAARSRHSGPAVVIMAGTAITVDALNAEGIFLGGLIVPGLDLMMESLSIRTAGIRSERGELHAFPTSTGDAVYSGAVHASVGAIELVRVSLAARSDIEPMCFLSGGAAELLQPLVHAPVQRVDNLVLEGLIRIALE